MKTGTICYIGEPRFAPTEAFLSNYKKYPPHGECLTFSAGHPADVTIMSPETQLKSAAKERGYILGNAIFWTAVRIARTKAWTHFLYVEPDCRFGKAGWDKVIFDEFFKAVNKPVIGGSVVVYAPFNSDMAAAKAFRRWYLRTKMFLPCPIYGCKGAEIKDGTMVFVNGALAVYDMAWLQKTFDLDKSIELALMSPYDMEIGKRLWEEHHERAYEHIAHLNSIWSGYGNVLTSEEERIEMLRHGDIVAVHQVKTNAVP